MVVVLESVPVNQAEQGLALFKRGPQIAASSPGGVAGASGPAPAEFGAGGHGVAGEGDGPGLRPAEGAGIGSGRVGRSGLGVGGWGGWRFWRLLVFCWVLNCKYIC